jgi:hypothetical protein
MEIEKAIKTMEYNKDLLGMPDQGSTWKPNANTIACDIAITALREKIEREKGCELCRDKTPIPQFGMPHEFLIRGDSLLFYDQELGWEGTKISHCPQCGRKLKGSGE